MNKRGQVTAFIVVGIVILLMVGTFIYLKNSQTEELLAPEVKQAQELAHEPIIINTFMQQCSEDAGKRALGLIGLQGGYSKLPLDASRTFSQGVLNFPYYYFTENINMPTEAEIAEQLRYAFTESISDHCLPELKTALADQGFTITEDLIPKITTTIADKSVIFELNKKILAQREDEEYRFDKAIVTIPSRIRTIIENNYFIMEEIKKYPNAVPRTALNEISAFDGFEIKVHLIPDEITAIYHIYDPIIKLDDEPYHFIWVQRGEEELEDTPDY